MLGFQPESISVILHGAVPAGRRRERAGHGTDDRRLALALLVRSAGGGTVPITTLEAPETLPELSVAVTT